MVPGDSDEPRQSLEVADGQAIYLPAATHNVRNVGDTEIVIIETEIK
jgi:mannose-6-phosphate isomerase-like protein (cupin superfamily)